MSTLADLSLVDVDERLMAEFEGRVGLEVVTRTVRQCCRELAGPYGDAAPAAVERLARERLLEVERRGARAATG